MNMKDDNDDAHSLDTWTPLGKAASDLLTKLRARTQPDSKLREQAQPESSGAEQPKRPLNLREMF
jgi:hypothetical protein